MKKYTVTFMMAIVAFSLLAATMAKERKLSVNTSASTVKWHAKKVTGEHYGKVPLSSGNLLLDGNVLKGGNFEIDVNSLTVEDIKDEKGNGRLTAHLKNNDFFATDQFPKANFIITSVKKSTGDKYDIQGDLTIKGITNKVSFPATVKSEKSLVKANATIKVDRTKFDIKFRSGNFFENLGDKTIEDEFTLTVELVADGAVALK